MEANGNSLPAGNVRSRRARDVGLSKILSQYIVAGCIRPDGAWHHRPCFCDLWNAYGVILFWPFDRHRFSLNWVYIIDLLHLGDFDYVFDCCSHLATASLRIWQVGLCLLAIYIGVCAWCSAETVKLVREQAPAQAPVYAYPEPLGPQRFRAVACVGDNYDHYFVFPLSHKAD